jgi:hypothetical protein
LATRCCSKAPCFVLHNALHVVEEINLWSSAWGPCVARCQGSFPTHSTGTLESSIATLRHQLDRLGDAIEVNIQGDWLFTDGVALSNPSYCWYAVALNIFVPSRPLLDDWRLPYSLILYGLVLFQGPSYSSLL